MIISEILEEMSNTYHYPVLYREVLELLLKAKKKQVIVDCTLGTGSHAVKFLEATGPETKLIGIDKDEDSLNIAGERLQQFTGRFTLVKGNFSDVDTILSECGLEKADIFLFDLGISSYQLNDSQRGFSFLKEGPLDMRMDRNAFLSAYDFVNNLSEIELESIFRKFGEERYSHKIAHYLVKARKREPIVTTAQLSQIIIEALPSRSQHQRIHPATRVFQSLRIAVNRELEALRTGLVKSVSLLNRGGRIGVISFHSLEDRIVKHTFRDHTNVLNRITKSPIVPGELEQKENTRSRSAKLRVVEKS